MTNISYKLLVAVTFAATVVESIMAVKCSGDALFNLMCIAGVTAFVFAMSFCGFIAEVRAESRPGSSRDSVTVG
ncbi:hypothetical protein R69746_06821 [Paraburkholderia aspalathi]|uniref:hypothetical protein n=1 Tax=Paraburkholderia aspalathi TaxID=1324617 RepID=UPI00190E47FC|nr:hypothetical protein [Paraburkholderia aspalathi]MBK3842858.1 hypothetical protein [Paraburkholderia aspalathi]CAE6838879.1 hypothetical protein R69746_06821 [Paraburkholderia aspalathi]